MAGADEQAVSRPTDLGDYRQRPRIDGSGWILRTLKYLRTAARATGREVLRRFEQIRHVFESRTGRGSLTPLPVRVFVFRSEAEFQPYQVNRNAAGYYQSGHARDYIAMQATGTDTYRVVYHEYTHLLLRHAGYHVPVWFNEGTAELFSTADVGGIRGANRRPDSITSGIRSERNECSIFPTLTSVDHDSSYYNEQGQGRHLLCPELGVDSHVEFCAGVPARTGEFHPADSGRRGSRAFISAGVRQRSRGRSAGSEGVCSQCQIRGTALPGRQIRCG